MRVVTPRGREFDPAELRREYRELHPQVVADLAQLCFASETTFAETERETCVNIGRQQVWLHINRYLGLSQEQVEAMMAGRGYELTTDEEP